MKKLFTLFAALCCMVGVAKAEFADGVKIYVDGTEVAAQEQACFTSGKITQGHISYDPEHHILYLYNAHISGTVGTALEISAPKDADFKVIMQLCGSGHSYIGTTASYSAGLALYCPLEIRGFSYLLTCSGNGSGIWINETASLTISGKVPVKASGKSYGVSGYGTVGNFPLLKIIGGSLEASNTSTSAACIYKVNLELEGSEISFPDGAVYDASKNGAVVKNGNYITNGKVKITPTDYMMYVYPRDVYSIYDDLTGIVGSYSIKKGDKEQPNPCVHASGDKFTVKLESGPDVKLWKGIEWYAGSYKTTGNTNEVEIEVPYTVSSNALCWASYNKNVELKERMYMLTYDVSPVFCETKNFNKNEELDALPGALEAATNIAYANNGTDGAGNLYFTKEQSSKVGIYRVEWDDYQKNKSNAEVHSVKGMQNTYYPFVGLSYDWVNEKMYAIAYKNGDSKWHLLDVDLSTGNFTEKGSLSKVSSTNPPIAMACDRNGDIYCMVYQESDPLLYKVNPTNGVMTLYSHVGRDFKANTDITTDNMYRFHTMQFDYVTNKLYWLASAYLNDYYVGEIDLTTGHVHTVAKAPTSKEITKNIGMFQRLPKVYTITAKTKEGSVGTTLVDGKPSVKALYGSTVTLTATGDKSEGTVFKQWNDGNKESTRTVTVTTTETYEAEFWYGEGVNTYPIWICGKQIHDNRLWFEKATMPTKITAGLITYDPEKKELVLDAKITSSDPEAGILIGEEGKATELTIRTGNSGSTISGTSSFIPLKLVNAKVKLTGDEKLTLEAAAVGAYLSKGSTLTIENAADVLLKGSYGIRGDDGSTSDKLRIRGSKVKIQGTSKAAHELADATWDYCTTSPTSLGFDKTEKTFVNSSFVAQATVSFEVDGYVLRCESEEEETGSFTMQLKDGSGETFKDGIGWFKNGDEVTITAKGATGFVFGRWEDDGNWGDPDKKDDWLKASREITMGSANKTYKALFYAQPKSGVTWYGISAKSDHFVQFRSRDYGAGVIESSSDASNITAGDCNGSYYYIADDANGEILRFSFSSVTKDKEQVNFDKTTKIATYSGTVTDMAYNFKDGKFYLVIDCDQKLYKINGENVEEIGEFITGELKTKVSIVSIAIDANGKKYVLSTAGILYTVKKENTKDKEVELEKVGDTGNVGVVPGNKPQSMAFDHLSGELYWGEKSYLRIIDTKTAESRIAGDLGQTKGNQGIIRALHRRDRKVTVSVEVAAECSNMGTVKVGPGEDTEYSLLQGASVTIVATPAEGYEFDHWAIKDDESSEPIKEATHTTRASSATYVAYFKAGEQGIEDVKSQESGVQKVLHNGTLYIIRDGKVYDATGNPVK